MSESAISSRSDIFISHANPEDNEFAIWLGAKLEALGFRVWADVMRLKGGQDWARRLERALQHDAQKVLFVGTPAAVEKQGTRNEIEMAGDIARKIGDKQFVIPLRVTPHEPMFRIAHIQYIDFYSNGWAAGLSELQDILLELAVRGRTASSPSALWCELQALKGKPLARKAETLISNSLKIIRLPERAYFYDFSGGIEVDKVPTYAAASPWPVVPHLHGFVSFACKEHLSEHFGARFPFSLVADIPTSLLIEDGWTNRGVRLGVTAARNYVTRMLNDSVEKALAARGLQRFLMGDGRTSWWFPISLGMAKVPFAFDGIAGNRQLVGHSVARQVYWHYGLSFPIRWRPEPHISANAAVVFTADGVTPLPDAARTHRLRRSFTKSWRNARWRDLMLAFLMRVSEDGRSLTIPVSPTSAMAVGLPPVLFDSDLSINELPDEASDDSDTDDADLDYDDIVDDEIGDQDD
jgi:hypothetical protein